MSESKTATETEAEPDLAEHSPARKLFSNASFLKGAVSPDGFPPDDRPEICFAGRSNVGKSSLINALCNQKNLARTSSRPGRTQEINIFTLGTSHYMVDLPGYGFARAPLKAIKAWQELTRQYLAGRPNLRRVFLLIDARHGPKASDAKMQEFLRLSAVTYQITLTKTDKLRPAEVKNALTACEKFVENCAAAYPEMIATSAERGDGLEALRNEIATII